MTYAPVCIPTLNRYEHLRKCLESLSRCTWADQTEVYVALDYPPANQWDKYAPGWEKNREFLYSCGNMGFKKLHVIERKYNYGLWKSTDEGNEKCLLQYIRSLYDRYIFTEDDNVFASNFLVYINKGLELFKDDSRVYSIGGYRFNYEIHFKENTFIRQSVDYSPWGVGEWSYKAKERIPYAWFREQISIANVVRLKREYGWAVVMNLILKSTKREEYNSCLDSDVWTYMEIMGLQQIVPTVTLVHNIGLDGTGVTMRNEKNQSWCDPKLNPLSEDADFEFIGNGYEYFEENKRIYYRGKYWMTEWQYFKKACRKLIKLMIGCLQ